MIWIHMDPDVDRGEPPRDGKWYQTIQGVLWWDQADGDANEPKGVWGDIDKAAPSLRLRAAPRWVLRFQMDVRHRPALVELFRRRGWTVLDEWPGWRLENLKEPPHGR